MTIVWGILCLGLIVFVHELGHFIVARFCGVTVESFSIGMGPVVFHKTIHGTDYRISLLPFGGYCGMKGEQAFQRALEQQLDAIPKEEGSFYGIHPLKRALIALAGPATNLLFAVIAFITIAMTGYTYYSADNRVIMADEVYKDANSAAHVAGLKTGDRITAIDDEPIENFSEISKVVSLNPEKPLEITATRDGMQLSFTVIPELDSSTGSGKIGVMNWIDPVVAKVVQESPAHKAGIMVGDRITSVDGIQTENTADIQKHIEGKTSVVIGVERMSPESHLGTQIDIEVQVEPNESLGLQFSVPAHEAKRFSFFPAIIQGFKETGKLIALTFKSIGLLFKGVDLSQAVSGPVRITVMLGDTVQSGFSAGFKTGFVSTMNFLALISVSLFIMNLLPIPILDGGIILFAVIEAIRRKPVLPPKAMYYSQFVGIAFIVLLFGLALFSDANYLIKDVLRR